MKLSLIILVFSISSFQNVIFAQSGLKLGTPNKKPDLYILCVGVTNNLKYPKKDAEDVINMFLSQKGHLFGAVHDTILTCKEKTGRSQIGDAIADFKRKNIQKKDVLIIFLSGHGQTSEAFGDIDFGFNSSDNLKEDEYNLVFYRQDIVRHLEAIECKKLIFIDACRSGAAKGQKGNDFSEIQKRISMTPTGMITISSSSGNQPSYEDTLWNNGAFTKVLIDGLNGQADKDSNDSISVQEIVDYLILGVPRLVNGFGLTQVPRIANLSSNLIPKDKNYEIFSYKYKETSTKRKTDNCEEQNSKPKPVKATNTIAIVGLKPSSTNEYDNFSSTIVRDYLEVGVKGDTKLAPYNQAISLAKSGIANKLCKGTNVFIPAEYNSVEYILVINREPTTYQFNSQTQLWIASITLSYCYINTLTKDIEKSGEKTITGTDSLKTEAENRGIERALEVLKLKAEISKQNQD